MEIERGVGRCGEKVRRLAGWKAKIGRLEEKKRWGGKQVERLGKRKPVEREEARQKRRHERALSSR